MIPTNFTELETIDIFCPKTSAKFVEYYSKLFIAVMAAKGAYTKN
jgi:hypothetical protein